MAVAVQKVNSTSAWQRNSAIMVNAAGWPESGHMSQHLVQVSGDPRRPGEVRKHKLPQKPESSADILTILGSLAGVASILLKVRPNVW